ncbi:MAG: PEP-CTERM sorting domain-containing protein [Fimbriimonadaceae bacterium]|nr:PEP-CTERM sorting domain-containing protein [Fimbriimonadaceae bacterium]
MRSSLVLLAAIAAAGAQAQLIVGNDQSGTATIWQVNVNTGVATALYSSTGSSAKPWGMAADNVGNKLYWNNGGNLYSATFADLLGNTAAPTPLAMTYNGSAVNFVGLGFDQASGKLLGTRNITTEAVYEIDVTTGVATLLTTYSTTLDLGGVEYDNATNKLYALSDAPSTARGLYEVDKTNGTATLKAPYPAGETDIDGLAVWNGSAYYVTDGPNTTQANFYVYDIATGTQTGTLASPFTGSGTFAGATYAPGLVPEPATMIALGAGLAALAARRRRNRR